MTIAPLEPADALDDAALAVAAAAGNQRAFSTIYDRYADRLYDFCVGMLRDGDAAADCVQDVFVTAATKLVQLQDPNRLRAWLYAIARHEALARIRDRRREMPIEELPETASSEPDLATVAARNELAALIAEACGGLSDRDRTVYELAYRHGLDGPELADALGVSHTNANTLVGRLRDGIERSLGALLVCRRIKANPAACPELSVVLGDWDGTFTVLMRKRTARHIDGCVACDAERRRMVNPVALLGGAPVFLPAPGWLRDVTLADATLVRPDSRSSDNESWWPPRAVDDREAASASSLSAAQARHLRTALIAALAVLGIAGMAQLLIDDRMKPAGTRVPPTSTSSTPAATFGIAGITASASTVTSGPPPDTTPATTEPELSVIPESSVPTLTTSPSRASTTRTTPTRSFAPSRNSSTASRTTAPEDEDEPTTRTSTRPPTSTSSSSSSSPPSTPTTTTTTSDPIE
ncbi:RNA polymerase sigma factor [Mycolicibacterium sp. P9-64]|uniref:RNA polymerase sigma factor n=1 Tax=Mycolicibacterium sp. P9-64 TaxID=2024612 RepID=UPI0011EE9E77|nr:RNA polymerase sigma factor [Mycolicibacterium sp. P9-64]KAA0086622.1 RNA polymerase sigma factor [Mycolicibacterium sp. P9-64]